MLVRLFKNTCKGHCKRSRREIQSRSEDTAIERRGYDLPRGSGILGARLSEPRGYLHS